MTTQLDLLQRDWCERMSAVVMDKMRGRQFTADDLHALVESPAHDNWYGVLMAQLRCKGLIERTGYQPSTRPERNGGVVRVWRIKEFQLA
jgi:hypothetical protein